MSGRPGGATRHWALQRLTSAALVPLGLWFLVSLLRQPSLEHAAVAAWLAHPLQALLAFLLGATLLWHSMQGVQVVIEDYVGGSLRGGAIAAARIAHVAAGIALVLAVFRLASGGGS